MDNETTRTPEQVGLGQKLHQAEAAIHFGRRAVADIVSAEPVDLDALATERQTIKDARAEVRTIRLQLDALRIANAVAQATWIR